MSPATEEEWRWAPGYEGDYEVSDQGRVRSWKWPGPPRLLSLNARAGGGGYKVVCLTRNAKQRSWYVHRLVMAAFVGPLPDGQVTRHLDGDSENNTLANLRYGTHEENAADQLAHGTHWTQTRSRCRNDHPLERSPDGVVKPCETCLQARRERDRKYVRAKRARVRVELGLPPARHYRTNRQPASQ